MHHFRRSPKEYHNALCIVSIKAMIHDREVKPLEPKRAGLNALVQLTGVSVERNLEAHGL